MAKKLIFDYTFDASAQTITIDGHISLKKLLFINNATRGSTIYALGDTSLRTTARTYDSAADTTTFTLNFDTGTAGHADTDDLQIFIDEQGAEFKPIDSLIDPVSKIRVSSPNTLIDTDFEYGLQSTKWETLERINEIPSFYSQSGDVPVSNIVEVISTNGSKSVTVKTSTDHGLSTNIPIDIRGLEDQTAEGSFIIKSVPSKKTFVYQTNTPVIVTGDISTVYTNLIIGRYYVGSIVKLGDYSAITTDESAQSVLTITTPYKSNYSVGTSFYLTNSIASQRKEFKGTAAPFDLSGNPDVSTNPGAVDFNETISTITSTYVELWEPLGVDVRTYIINPVAGNSSIDVSTGIITYYDDNGVLANHDLVTGDMVIITSKNGVTSNDLQEKVQSGSNSSTTTGGNGIYYVIRVDDQTFKLASTPDNCVADISISYTGAQTTGSHFTFRRFGRGYASTAMNPFHYNIIEAGKTVAQGNSAFGRRQRYFRPEAIDINNDTITIPNHQFKEGQPVGVSIGPTPNTLPAGMHKSTNTQIGLMYIGVIDVNKIKLYSTQSGRPSSTDTDYFDGNDALVNLTSQGVNYTWGAPFSIWPGIKLAYTRAYADLNITYANSFDKRNRIICDYEFVNFEEGDKVVFYSDGAVGMDINEATTNWEYITDSDYKKTVYYVRYPAVNTFSNNKTAFEFSISKTPNGPILNLSGTDKNNEETFVFKIEEIETANTWYFENHGFTLNEKGYPDYWLQYRFDANNSVGTTVGNLTINYWYWMYPINDNHIRLAQAETATGIDQLTHIKAVTDVEWPSGTDGNQRDASSSLKGFSTFGTDFTNYKVRFIGQNHYNPYKNTFYIPNHGFTEGQSLRYNSNGNNDIQPIQNGNTYYVKNVSENRFSLSETYDGDPINLTQASSTSVPNHYFENTSVEGSIDGSYTISSKNVDGLRYDLSTDQQIFGKQIIFNPQKCVNQKNGHFYIKNHGLSTGTVLVYSIIDGATDTAYAIGSQPSPPAGSPYNSLTDGETYYCIRISKNFFAIASSLANAQAGIQIKEYYNYGNKVGDDASHKFVSGSVFGQVQGSGRVTFTSKDTIFDGSAVGSINTNSDRIIISAHGFNTGDFVEYNAYGNASPIQGLEFGRKYYVRYEGSGEFELYNTISDAWRRYRPVDILGVGEGTTHIFKISRNSIRGSRYRGIWNTNTNYFAGDIVQDDDNNNTYWISHRDNLGNYDDLIQDTPAVNTAKDPVATANNWPNATSFWKRLDEPGESQVTGSDLDTNFSYQYTPSETITIDDERRIGYSNTRHPEYYTTYNQVSGTTVTTAHDHGFYTGDCVYYRNQGYYNALEAGIITNLPTDYNGVTDGSFYYVNVQTTTTFSVHDTIDEARQGINAITLGNSTGNTSYYSMHRWWSFESRLVNAKITSITESNDMTIEDPFTPTVIEFNPQEITPIQIVNFTPDTEDGETFYLPGYADKLLSGTRVIYSKPNDSTAIGGLTAGGSYFVGAMGNDYYKMFGNATNVHGQRKMGFARRRDEDVNITSTGTGDKHFFTIMSENYNCDEYIVPTKLYMKPSSYSLHRPFDGGVEINPGTSADSSIVRQTRRYFRYQSGKGLQYSTATNFNAPIEVRTLTGSSDIATVVTRKPHNLTQNDSIIIEDVSVSSGTNYYNSESLSVNTVIDDYTFTYQMTGTPTDTAPGGFPTLNKDGWQNGVIRAGMFDDQNGFFYEYDGSYLYAVRRSSTAQIAGTIDLVNDSQVINGSGTSFQKQLNVDDNIVVRGQSYKITDIPSNTQLIISRPYIGITASRVIATKTIDTKVPQSNWNIDRCDGTGHSGYELNIRRLQMCYIDYSWYGGGKIRFGFKDQHGSVFYCHSFIHNNQFTEAYFRSGNLPARYEAKVFGDKSANIKYAPSLFHWGASVIMDGLFEDDKAYLFSASSPTIFMLNQKVDGDPEQASREYPVLTVRLAPSVDSGLTGALGTRDLINRMQLQLKQVSVSLSDGGTTAGATSVNRYGTDSQRKSATVRLILNTDLSKPFFTKEAAPALSEVIYHNPTTDTEFNQLDDRFSNGTVLYEFRVGADETIEQELGDVVNLGNSILGGDYTFPNGPDTLTVVVIPDGEYTSTSRQYTNCNARVTWTESQA
jgi:hypothetical protein